MKLRNVIVAAALLALAFGSAGSAQSSSLTWLAQSKVKTGMVDDAVALALEEQEFYDGLIADGTIIAWGLATRVTHRPGDTYNFTQFVVVPNWEHVDQWASKTMQTMMSRGPEEAAALEERAAKIFVEDSHSDIVTESTSWFGTGDARPRYVYVGEFFANPGHENEMTELYNSLLVPIGKQLIEEGLLAGFGLDTPSLHTGDGWTHSTVYQFTSLAGVDRLHEEIGKAVTPETAARLTAAHDAARHRDDLWMILHMGGAPDQ
jgi:hypothetical protein